METNTVPHYDDSINTTGCCPKFNPAGWNGRNLHFRNKVFARATTRSMLHLPLDMGRVFGRVQAKIDAAHATDPDDIIVLSRDISPWTSEHLFAVNKALPNEEMITLSGDFVTKVFEGPYRDAKEWHSIMQDLAGSTGTPQEDIYFFYTTCPKCAKAYGKNYVVGVARTA